MAAPTNAANVKKVLANSEPSTWHFSDLSDKADDVRSSRAVSLHFQILPSLLNFASRGHHAAMPYEDVAAFIAKLRKREATSLLALELCILTAARSGEILGMRWPEIDLDKKIWTVPANRMKAGREHRIPLSPRAVAMLRRLEKIKAGEFVRNKPLSNMAMEMVLRRMNIQDATVHGFRSSFRDWAGNISSFPREITETALAHVIGDKAEQAYRRSDALEKRRKLMEAWAAYCEPKKAGNVVLIGSRKRVSGFQQNRDRRCP
jgi:integrase